MYERGLADLDAVAGLLGAGPFLFGDRTLRDIGLDRGGPGYAARSGRAFPAPFRRDLIEAMDRRHWWATPAASILQPSAP